VRARETFQEARTLTGLVQDGQTAAGFQCRAGAKASWKVRASLQLPSLGASRAGILSRQRMAQVGQQRLQVPERIPLAGPGLLQAEAPGAGLPRKVTADLPVAQQVGTITRWIKVSQQLPSPITSLSLRRRVFLRLPVLSAATGKQYPAGSKQT